MNNQLDLFPKHKPGTMPARVEQMVGALHFCRVRNAAWFQDRYGWSDRTCRSIAEASDGRIISSNAGYMLTERASPEEFAQANGRIYSQARKMLRRALKERRVRHELIGAGS